MNGLILASYILKVNQDHYRPARFPEYEAERHASARRTLTSLAASVLGLGVLIAVISAL